MHKSFRGVTLVQRTECELEFWKQNRQYGQVSFKSKCLPTLDYVVQLLPDICHNKQDLSEVGGASKETHNVTQYC